MSSSAEPHLNGSWPAPAADERLVESTSASNPTDFDGPATDDFRFAFRCLGVDRPELDWIDERSAEESRRRFSFVELRLDGSRRARPAEDRSPESTSASNTTDFDGLPRAEPDTDDFRDDFWLDRALCAVSLSPTGGTSPLRSSPPDASAVDVDLRDFLLLFLRFPS